MFSKISIFALLSVQIINAQYLGNASPMNPAISGYGLNGLANPGLARNPLRGISPAEELAETIEINKMAYGNLANGMAMNSAFASMAGYNPELNSFSGGGLVVTSSSPIAPSGMTVHSENLVVEGPLAVTGQMPFLGVVEVEGPLPASGQGAVAYGAGNGNIGMVAENGMGPNGMGPNGMTNAGVTARLVNGYGPY